MFVQPINKGIKPRFGLNVRAEDFKCQVKKEDKKENKKVK